MDEDDDDEDDDDEELPLPLFVVVPLVFPLLTCKATVDGVVEVDEGFIMFNGTFREIIYSTKLILPILHVH